MPNVADILDWPALYRLWQLPFVRSKLRPFLEQCELEPGMRVLDVGCGPGTNSLLFRECSYLGIDIHDKYIQAARRRYRGEFQQADARQFQPADNTRFDLILINSFLHHIDDTNTSRILRQMHSLLSDTGHLHLMELVLPRRASLARWLAQRDRGDFPRTLEHWQELLNAQFESLCWRPYRLECLGLGLWQMVYFKGCRKDD